MKSGLTAAALCVALQAATPAWSQQNKANGALVAGAYPGRAGGRPDQAEMAKRQIPGLALGIVRNGELVSVALHQIPGDALPFRNP